MSGHRKFISFGTITGIGGFDDLVASRTSRQGPQNSYTTSSSLTPSATSYSSSTLQPSQQSATATNCYISGTVTKTGGQNGLAYCYQGTNFYNNVVIADSSTTQPALYVRGISGTNGNISSNIVFNFGTGDAGRWVYGNGYNNYCYAASANAIDVGNNCSKFVGNTAITNSTTSAAMGCYGTLIQGNTAINLNASNTNVALIVGRTSATTSEIYNNKAEVANGSVYNIQLTATGTLYVANNVMGLTGLGLDLNGNTNAMTNTPDAYGNIKLG